MFDRCVVLNLKRRPDRWRKMCRNVEAIDWPFRPLERMQAIDGREHPPPSWFGGSAGAWGCLLSHLAVLNLAVIAKCDSILILEDDALFHPRFGVLAPEFMRAVPDDWQAVYLGGRHYVDEFMPTPVNSLVLKGRCVLGTFCYAVRGAALHVLHRAIALNMQSISEDQWNVDRLWGRLHRDSMVRVYTPWKWLVYHGAGVSDTNGAGYPDLKFDLPPVIRGYLRRHYEEVSQ